MAQQQPRRERFDQRARPHQPHISAAQGFVQPLLAQPDARHSPKIGVHIEVHVGAGVLQAQVGLGGADQQPEDAGTAIARRQSGELEPRHRRLGRQAGDVQPAAHVPHQQLRVEVLRVESARGLLPPLAQFLDHCTEALA
jgi:hypothetical protein